MESLEPRQLFIDFLCYVCLYLNKALFSFLYLCKSTSWTIFRVRTLFSNGHSYFLLEILTLFMRKNKLYSYISVHDVYFVLVKYFVELLFFRKIFRSRLKKFFKNWFWCSKDIVHWTILFLFLIVVIGRCWSKVQHFTKTTEL